MNEILSYRLASMPSAQCHVNFHYHDGILSSVTLVSYSTTVIAITGLDEDDPWWSCSGTYSKTTARHIGRFTSEFLGSNLYHTAKDMVINGYLEQVSHEQLVALERAVSMYLDGYGGKKYYGLY